MSEFTTRVRFEIYYSHRSLNPDGKWLLCGQGGPSVEALQRLWQMLLELAEQHSQTAGQVSTGWPLLDQWALLPTTDGAKRSAVTNSCLALDALNGAA